MREYSRAFSACLVSVVLVAAAVSAQRTSLSDEEVQRAIEAGPKTTPDSPPFLVRFDGGFGIRMITPGGMVQFIAKSRARDYKQTQVSDIPAIERRPLLTVIASPRTPSRVTSLTPAVRRIVLTSIDRARVVEPFEEQRQPITFSNALGGKISSYEMTSTFQLDAVDKLIAADGGFVVVVVPESAVFAEGRFEIKKTEFGALP